MQLPQLAVDEASPASVLRLPQLNDGASRPIARGKFVFLGDEKFHVRGVTYGPFGPEGRELPQRDLALRDLEQIASSGLNTLRTFTVPPGWLLDAAIELGLRVMVGMPWEQHVAFLDESRRARDIEKRLRRGVRACAGHPGVLCFAVGNEIPASIVRWYGHRRVERYLERLAGAVRDEDPDALVTYVNYPSTEYLELPFLDLLCFNVYLEQANRLAAYLARLHNVAGDRPLILSEVGLDSRRNGPGTQALGLKEQIGTAFTGGCAGVVVFSWSDRWHRGGVAIDDWDFGLTDRSGRAKPALAAVRKAMSEAPFPRDVAWPRISVVVCSLNGARTIRDCMEGLSHIDYPNFEVIVVNDGSTDPTAVISRSYGFPVISTGNMGLSAARNAGFMAATGEIVAYLDDDAYPDPQWLRYLALSFLRTEHAGVGGPNIAPPGDGSVAECVANAPGGPIHVLVSDQEAEHIPGCNMAFRKSVLEEIGGFDPTFRVAGDDVDICWRIRDLGMTIGFSPAAVVWHHRRDSIRGYWKQQKGYGKAEALLERKWPERYNALGHVSWTGGVYGPGSTALLGRRSRIYQGTWGRAPFQMADRKPPHPLWSLLTMPESFLAVAALVALSLLGLVWTPLLVAAPLALLLVLGSIARAWSAAGAVWDGSRSPDRRLRRRVITALLHLLQPVARLQGRVFHGLTPWRARRGSGPHASVPWPRSYSVWRERWRATEDTLTAIEAAVRVLGHVVIRGGPFERWDLEVRGGSVGGARLLLAVEEHGSGRQLTRVRSRPRVSRFVIGAWLGLSGLAGGAALAGAAWIPGAVLGAVAAVLGIAMFRQCAVACGAVRAAVSGPEGTNEDRS